MQDDNPINNYLDDAGRVTHWASANKKSEQDAILAHLADKFDREDSYTEREVNELLNLWHTFEDHALLRRELISRGYMGRADDGSKYWRKT